MLFQASRSSRSSPRPLLLSHLNNNTTTWNATSRTLSTHTLSPGHFQTRMTLANGYAGISVSALGPFFERDVDAGDTSGWPLYTRRQAFATVAGFYTGVESFVAGVPHWAGLLVEADDGKVLRAGTDPAHVEGFKSWVGFGEGRMGWGFLWRPGGVGAGVRVEYEMFVHKLEVAKAVVRVRLTSEKEEERRVRVVDVLEGTAAVRARGAETGFEGGEGGRSVWAGVAPDRMDGVNAYVVSTLIGGDEVDWASRVQVEGERYFVGGEDMSVAQAVEVRLEAGRTVEVVKFVGIASSDAFEDPKGTAWNASREGAAAGFEALLASHVEEWGVVLPRDGVDWYEDEEGKVPKDGLLQELQVSSVVNPFMILQNTVGPNAVAAAGGNARLNVNSVPVSGLGSDNYAGMIFWDAEIWMAPGLQVSHPAHIESVVNYRREKHQKAKENIQLAARSATKNQTGRFTGGAVFPWTSARYGDCAPTGACFDYEYHINGDIGIALRNQFVASGDAQKYKDELLPIADDIAYFHGELLDFNSTSGFYEIWDATDPDEFANHVNNAAFTTALIQKHFDETNELNAFFGLPVNETWINMSSNMRLPVNEEAGIILEYDKMDGSIVVKQADVVLIDDILHYPNPYSLANLDYYAHKQSPDGPAMTWGAFSIAANRVSPSGCASFTYHLQSQQPYLRLPWFQYSEQASDDWKTNGGWHPAFPFLTGMGGTHRVAVFGYLGLRLFVDRLELDPSLPPQIPRLNYRTFYWQGYGIDAVSNATHTTLRRMPDRILATANRAFADAPIPVVVPIQGGGGNNFTLAPSETLVIPNRMLGQTATTPGNILQCKPIVDFSSSSSSSNTSSRPQNNNPALYVPGHFPLSAIDGATATKWQPANATALSYLTVDLSTPNNNNNPFHRIRSITLDWGALPPAYFEVLFSNATLPPFTTPSAPNADVRNVTAGVPKISAPWDPRRDKEVRAVMRGNVTEVRFEEEGVQGEVWSGRFAHLGIRGRVDGVDEGGGGATVAEWSVVRWGE